MTPCTPGDARTAGRSLGSMKSSASPHAGLPRSVTQGEFRRFGLLHLRDQSQFDVGVAATSERSTRFGIEFDDSGEGFDRRFLTISAPRTDRALAMLGPVGVEFFAWRGTIPDNRTGPAETYLRQVAPWVDPDSEQMTTGRGCPEIPQRETLEFQRVGRHQGAQRRRSGRGSRWASNCSSMPDRRFA